MTKHLGTGIRVSDQSVFSTERRKLICCHCGATLTKGDGHGRNGCNGWPVVTRWVPADATPDEIAIARAMGGSPIIPAVNDLGGGWVAPGPDPLPASSAGAARRALRTLGVRLRALWSWRVRRDGR